MALSFFWRMTGFSVAKSLFKSRNMAPVMRPFWDWLYTVADSEGGGPGGMPKNVKGSH